MTTEWMRPLTRKSIAVVAVAAIAAGTALAGTLVAQESGKKPATPEVLAKVGDQTVDRAAVMEEAKAALAEVESTRLKCEQDADRSEHEALENAVDRVVRKRLFAMEAQKRGMTEDALREELKTKTGEVTDADVDAFYEANKSRIKETKEQIADRIRAYLMQQKLAQAENDFFAEAEKNFAVDVLLEPMRVDVAATGSGRGPADAPVTIVEFSDFQCPYCKRVLPTLEQVEQKYGDQVRLVYRHYPLSIHPEAQKAAEAANCAGDQGKFWEMHDLLFEEQQKLAIVDLKDKATRLGLDAEKFGQCLDSNQHAETVATDMRDAIAAGVDGTPAFFVNGRFLSGAVPLEKMAELIDDEIKRAKRAD
jgi:protein-disulfide isomerase